MRFITEFKLERHHFENAWYKAGLQNKRQILQSGLGDLISESFGWQNPVNGDEFHHRLGIEAFPVDKWLAFKSELLSSDDFNAYAYKKLLDLISELESFGKPAGAAKEL